MISYKGNIETADANATFTPTVALRSH